MFLKSYEHCLPEPSPPSHVCTHLPGEPLTCSYSNGCQPPGSRARRWRGAGVSALPQRDRHDGNHDTLHSCSGRLGHESPPPQGPGLFPSSLPVEAQKYGKEQDQTQPGLGALSPEICEEEAWVTWCLSPCRGQNQALARDGLSLLYAHREGGL